MSSAITKKLFLKTQNPILIINQPKSFEKVLEKINCQVDTSIKQKYDFILLFASTQNEAKSLIKNVLDSLNHDGIFWFCYPKGTSKNYKSDINRNNSWDLFKPYSYQAVSQVAIDEDWSALRFRHESLVGKN